MAAEDDPTSSPDLEAEHREDILLVAADVFHDVGYAQAGLDLIAARAGLSTDVVTGHFESKATLLVEAAGREAQDFFARVMRSLNNGARGPAVLTQLIVELQAGAPLPMHRLLAETLAAGIRHPEVRRALAPHLSYAASAVAVVIRQAQTDGLIASDVDVDATVHVCLTLMFGSCLFKALEVAQPDHDTARSVILKFVDGLGHAPGPSIDLREAVPDGGEVSPAPAPLHPHET